MCLLACVAVGSFRFLASSQAGQARKARICTRHLRMYTSKPREKRPGEEVAAYAKNTHGFASPPACVASLSDEKEEYFHFLPIVGHVTAIFFVLPKDHLNGPPRVNFPRVSSVVFVPSFSQAEGLAANSSWRLSGP